MQRVRIGLTGLAFVFILVLLAAIFIRPSQEVPITANSLDQQRGIGAAPGPAPDNEAQPKDPLAELGVAPGNADVNDAASAPTANGAAPSGAPQPQQ
ncbi:MAG TPA: hypothetical protein VK472_04170 [Allosphingosinicella sp.]|nr:hypothetical protein [Allosphingosinicella sp.]